MLKPSLKHYCDKNNLFTRGTPEQFDRMLKLPVHDIATCIWLCSETDKRPEEIERELERSDNIDR